MSEEAVKKQIEGVCTEISEKNGWTAFAIDVGSQYPVRLSTKLPALIEQGRAAGNQRAVWSFKESQGGENPNKPGTHYTNRYLDGVEVGGTVSQQAATASRAFPETDSTRQSIERQTIVKAAISLYPSALIKKDADWFALIARIAEFCAGVDAADAHPTDDTDDDIPFG